MNDPSSTHSSPRSFASDLSSSYPAAYPHYHPHHPHHSHTYPIPHYPSRPAHKSTLNALPISLSLSVSTSTTASDPDPSEKTARPSNAHKHAQFLSGTLHTTSSGTDPSDTHPEPARSLLFAEDPSVASDDPGATPIVTHPPSTTSAAPLNSAEPSSNPAPLAHQDFSLGDTPGLERGLSRPLTLAEQEKLAHLDRLKFFLATAPSQWDGVRSAQSFAPTSGANAYPSASVGVPSTVGSSTGWGMGLPPPGNGTGPGPGGDAYAQGMHPSLNRFMLPSQEFVTCVLWNGLYHITGTDIVRALVFRFEAFGRPVRNMKKFEEGVFSDLRNLKPGVDACLEEPKSPFLDLLFKYQCIRTQKKQKVFYWFSVPHDRLFLDALERDLKREKMGFEATTQVVGEPAMSFLYDPKRSLYEQFAKAQGVKDGEGELESVVRRAEQEGIVDGLTAGASSESDVELIEGANGMVNLHIGAEDSEMSDADDLSGLTEEEREKRKALKQERQRKRHLQKVNGGTPFFSNLFGLFEGSPTYKQRRKKNPTAGSALSRSVSSSSSASFRRGSEDFDDRGRPRSIGPYGSGLAERHHHHHSQSASVSRERPYPYPQPYSHINRPFPFPSMADEFGPGSMDFKERAEPNAAELFHKQARQELVPADGVVKKPKVPHVLPEVGVMISGGFTAHQVQAVGGGGQQQQQQPYPGQPGQLPPDVQQQPQPLDPSTYAGANGYDPSGGIYSSQQQQQQQQTAADSTAQCTGTAQYETLTPDGKFRAFICPLYSCGRLFKRMEHLKRHLRTHTMERPFTCTICQKRFSRSDNLNQHLRTHDRTGSALGNAGGAGAGGGGSGFAGGAAGASGMAGGMAGPGMDMGMGLDMSMGMWRDHGDEGDLSGAESEGFDEEGFMYAAAQQQMMNDPTGMFGMGMMNNAVLGQMGAGAMGPGGFDMQMCEIEVQAGDVREIPGGEEEGLVLRTGQMPQFAVHQVQHQQQQQQQQNAMYATTTGTTTEYGGADPAAAQWAARPPQQNSGFSNMAVPSPPSGSIPQIRSNNRSSMGSTPAGYMRPTHSASSSTSSLSAYTGGASDTNDDYVTSMSAPSHKQAFDHGSLYPPAMLDSAAASSLVSAAAAAVAASGNNGGPIRRHRSMTPSLIRNGEPIRRPLTANSGNGSSEFVSHSGSGSPGSSGVRGYHPYAGGYASSSRSGSTHSSPVVYNVPLGGVDGTQQQQPQQQGLRRSESRTGFNLQEQMQMMQQSQQGGGENMFRTESPSSFHTQQQQQQQTESPAPYTMELPPQVHQMYGHSNTVPTGVYDAQHQQLGVEGGYYQQQHATL